MFPLAFLAAPLIQNALGNALGGLFNQNQGGHCHGHHGHTHGQGINERLAAEDFKDGMQKLANGDRAGAREEFREGLSRLAQGPGPVLNEATTQQVLAAEDRKDAFQDFSRGQWASGFEELGEASRRSWY